MTEIILAATTLALGYIANLIGQLCTANNSAGGVVNPIKWVKKRPYRTALGLIGSLVGFFVLFSTGQLTVVTAFASGYMGQDVLDRVSDAASNKFSGV